MTTEAAVVNAPQPLFNEVSTLALRQDDPISLLFICKTLGLLALLLVAVYVVLRWYANRQGQGVANQVNPTLRCVQALRLSARTKAYLLDIEGARVLVTETPTGTTLLKLSNAAPDGGLGQ